MQLKVIRADDSITHVALHGRLDIEGVNEIQYDFLLKTTSLPRSTLVDLSRVTYIASLGIGMLVSAAKYLDRHGVKMVLVRPSPLVRTTLEASCLHQVIPIVDEESAAIEIVG